MKKASERGAVSPMSKQHEAPRVPTVPNSFFIEIQTGKSKRAKTYYTTYKDSFCTQFCTMEGPIAWDDDIKNSIMQVEKFQDCRLDKIHYIWRISNGKIKAMDVAEPYIIKMFQDGPM